VPAGAAGTSPGLGSARAFARAFVLAVAGKKVDIALAHHPAAGRALAGVVPLVCAGREAIDDVTRADMGTASPSTVRPRAVELT
jgi:hypothetical protein